MGALATQQHEEKTSGAASLFQKLETPAPLVREPLFPGPPASEELIMKLQRVCRVEPFFADRLFKSIGLVPFSCESVEDFFQGLVCAQMKFVDYSEQVRIARLKKEGCAQLCRAYDTRWKRMRQTFNKDELRRVVVTSLDAYRRHVPASLRRASLEVTEACPGSRIMVRSYFGGDEVEGFVLQVEILGFSYPFAAWASCSAAGY